MQRITGLPDEQVLAYEAQAEAVMRAALEHVMDVIARRIEASMPVLASVLVAADQGDEIPPSEVPVGDGLPAGQPYVSPDDLASIPPLWQEAVTQQILPIVAQVFLDAAGRTHANIVDASSITSLPSVGSLAAEQYLARAQNTFEQVGDDLWATARTELSDGFERGESIPQLAERLRASAGVTARTGVLVARTQVNEASNAGSFATAQASGLKMQKEWIATPDLRTRPTHLAADGQRVDLNDPFIVGGYSAMFPAAPTLPPAERYSCRCTQGYLMPDRAPAQVRTQDLQDQQLADLPGTSTVDDLAAAQHARLQQIIDEQHAAVEQVVQDVHQAFRDRFGKAAGPDFDVPARGPTAPPGYVRPSLKAAKTPRELRRVWQDEAQAATGFPFFVQAMPRGISMVTAREYAEGTLQMLERFPGARVDQIKWFDDAVSKSYAQVRRGGHAIEFNMKYASETGRPRFLESRRRDAAGWDVGDTSWGVRNDTTGQGVVYHEFMHILDLENTREKIHGSLVPLLIREADREGVTDIVDLIERRISSYAASSKGNMQELIAEAGADVMVNGAQASQLSRSIFDLLQAEYRARGFALRVAPVDELAAEAEQFGLGEVFPKLAKATKGSTIGDVVRGPTQFELAMGDAEVPPRLFRSGDFGDHPLLGTEGLVEHRGMRLPESFHSPLERIRKGEFEIRPGLTQAESEALDLYALSAVADPLNGAWRAGRTASGVVRAARRDVDLETVSRDLDSAIAASELTEGANLYRGVLMRPFDVGKLQEGATTTESGFLSTTTDEQNAFQIIDWRKGKGTGGKTPVIFKILAPKGTHAAVAHSEELELLLGRGRTLRVVDVLKPTQPGDIRVVTVELLPEGTALPVVAAPKALGSQTVAQLRALAKERGIVVPAATRKADLVKMLEQAPVARQAAIDAARPVADLAVRMDEIVANGASRKALLHTVDTLGEQAGLDAAELTRLRALVDDPAALRAATRDLATRAGADLTGATSDVVRFDRTLHEPIGTIAPGAPVEIVRPGVSVRVGDETVPVRKATVQATDRALTPAPVVAPAPPLSRAPLAYQARQDALRVDAARPTLPGKSRRMSGESAYTTRVEHEGGPPTITKDYTRQNETLAQGKRSADAEELGALVDDAVGLRAPTVIRTGPRSIEESFLEGQSGEEILPWPHTITDELISSDDGRLIGLSDILVGESDRNAGNFMRLTADQRLASIDRGAAFQTPKLAGAQSPFAESFAPDGKWAKSIDIAPQDLAVIRARLEALRPEFERLGRATWHKQVMARLVEVEKRATGTTIRLPEARADLTSITSRAAQRAEVRARAAAITAQRGNAALLARVDELVQAKASKAVIRQEFDPALRQAEQLYAGADEGVANALRDALDSGEPAKLRAAITRQSKTSGLTPIGKAGAKAKFDPATMEGVGGTAIPDGADVIVVRRGTSIAGIETSEKATVRLARAPSTEKTVAKGDFTGLTRVGEQLGGNPGGIFEAGDGSRWYVKAARNPEQLRSEALALDLYRASGLDVPDVVLGEGVGELGQGTQIASRIVEGAEPDLRRRLADEAYRAQVQEGFAVDAWLGNRDVLGASLDNILTTVAGTPIRIEAGGALRFRALGEAKDFGPDVTELDTMRAAGRSAAKVFGDMTPEQIIASAERVRKVMPTKIKALVKKHGLDPELADTLIARRADILRRAEALAGPKSMTTREYNAAIKDAAKGQEALDATSGGHRYVPATEPGEEGRDIWRGITDEDAQNALDGYLANDFMVVNDALRLHPGLSDVDRRLGRELASDIDIGFDQSRLTQDVELWRSPGSGRGIFGDPDAWGDDLAGFEWSDPAYSSTSASKKVADRFTKDGGVRLRILAPQGTKAIQLSEMPARGESTSGFELLIDEAEVLLARGARYRVVKDRGWTEITHPTGHHRIRVRDLDVEVVVPDVTPPLPWATK